MRYVILRDDDTNALTPVACLERLYRPFLERGLPVNLAVIPAVRTDVRRPDGRLEGYLGAGRPPANGTVSVGRNTELTNYLRENRGLHVVQHGWDHSWLEFDHCGRAAAERRIEAGARRLIEAGLPRPQAFVAPYDRLSRATLQVAQDCFRVVSTGWFELRRLPRRWWPAYLWKKLRRHSHWRAGRTVLLSHPGCILSHVHTRRGMIERIQRTLAERRLTVLVTHWWEYFPGGEPDREFIDVLHRTAALLCDDPETKVISFDDLVDGSIPLH